MSCLTFVNITMFVDYFVALRVDFYLFSNIILDLCSSNQLVLGFSYG